jgi:hypothetical protein
VIFCLCVSFMWFSERERERERDAILIHVGKQLWNTTDPHVTENMELERKASDPVPETI